MSAPFNFHVITIMTHMPVMWECALCLQRGPSVGTEPIPTSLAYDDITYKGNNLHRSRSVQVIAFVSCVLSKTSVPTAAIYNVSINNSVNTLVPIPSTGAPQYTFTGLTNNTVYSVSVVAINCAGSSSPVTLTFHYFIQLHTISSCIFM